MVKGYIFGFGEHDFWISRQVLPTGTDFRGDMTTMKFGGVGAWVWSRGSFLWLGTFIFGFLVQFLLLVSIFSSI